jgi:hypothetical protein
MRTQHKNVWIALGLFWGCAILAAYLLMSSLSSCGLANINPDWVHVVDPPEPIENCEAYEPITTPVFSSFFINLDVAQSNPVFYKNGQPINNFYQSIYYSGQNIGGISSGFYGSNQIYVAYGPNGTGTKHYLQFTKQGMNFRGALTFDQYWNELQSHRSAQFIRFSNTGYTCAQIEQVLNFFIYECYQTPDIIDLRPVSVGSCVFDPELISELQLRGSNVMQ